MSQLIIFIRALSIVIPVIFTSTTVLGQLSKGDKLRNDGNLTGAIHAYSETFMKEPKDSKNTYNLACAYALAYQMDSAFHYLGIALIDDQSLWALADPDLLPLLKHDKWRDVVDQQLKKFQGVNGKLKEPEYTVDLLTVIKKDQAYDYYIDQAKKEFMKNGEPPFWYYPLGSIKEELVRSNFREMQDMLKKYGWPKYSTVGRLAADAPLLVINHHPSDDVRKQYIDQIKKACLSGEGSCMEYAKIQDRILVNDDLPQIYGMQFRYDEKRKLEPFPIKDPEYVDYRREQIGLEPLNKYLKKKIDYDWTVEQKKP